MEPSTTQPQTTAQAPSAPLPESSHKNLYVIISGVIGVMVVIGAFVGMYSWQQSTHKAEIDVVIAQKAAAEQEVASLKIDIVKEQESVDTENELLEMFKSIVANKYNLSGTSTIKMMGITKSEDGNAYEIGVNINCKEGGSEEENLGCAGIEKFYKRSNGMWTIVGFNDNCPLDLEAEGLCAKAGF